MRKKCLSEWLLISFYDFLARRVPENVKTARVIRQTTLKGKKTDFHWKVQLAKLHIAVINQPRRSCPVWIISQLSLQRLPAPVFSTRNLGGPPTKAQAPFYWLPSRFHHYHFTVRICCGSHFSLSYPRGQSLVIIEKIWDEWGKIIWILWKQRGEMRSLLIANWPAELYFFAQMVKQRKDVVPVF